MMLKKAFCKIIVKIIDLEFETFKRMVDCILDKHAPLKRRYVRDTHAPFIDKNINKQIMKRSCLRNKFLNSKSDTDRKDYNCTAEPMC